MGLSGPRRLTCPIKTFLLNTLVKEQTFSWQTSNLDTLGSILACCYDTASNSGLICMRLVQRALLWTYKRMVAHRNPVWREKTRLTSPDVRAAATSKDWRNLAIWQFGRAKIVTFISLACFGRANLTIHFLDQREDKRRFCSQGGSLWIISLYVSGKLPTDPSPRQTSTNTSHLRQNIGLGEG